MRRKRFVVAPSLAVLVAAGCASSNHDAGAPPAQGSISAPVTAAAGSPPSAAARSAPDDTYSYHRDGARTGYDARTPPFTHWAKAWTADLDGQVYGQPLVVGGHVIAVTENDTAYALAVDSGTVLWRTRLAVPASQSDLPCGNIAPTVGITSTPAYDPGSNRVFTVALTKTGSTLAHVLFALDPSDGHIAFRRDIDANAPGIDPVAMNQRGALTITGGRVYVPYGGNFGDCGRYRGAIVSSRLDGTGPLTQLVVPTPREGGTWAPGGIAVDARGDLYASTGNGAVGEGDTGYDGSDSVMKLSPSLARLSVFAPAGWRSENASDTDLGSSSPLLVGAYVWIQGKSSTGYLLRQDDLGGVGRPFRTVGGACASQFGGPAAHGLTVYASCTDGIRQLLVSAGGGVRLGWQASVYGSPVVGGGVVVVVDPSSGVLHALDEQSGADRGQIAVGAVSHFATPALHDDLVLAPTLSGITAVHGA